MSDAITKFLNQAAREIAGKQVKVGFIDGATYPDGTSVAAIAAQNEFGNTAKRIPSRPFFRNAIALKEKEWKELIPRGIMAGRPIAEIMEVVGAVIAADVRDSIIQLTDPALAAYTIKKRKERGNDSTKPLEDTKVMLNDVTYQVGENESS